ncbi:MAG: UDP-N-acetylmuramate--L-alanine ligase [bacterium]|nr:UDP-N-acetylmuramate--L-alanine ligase [bacterium]
MKQKQRIHFIGIGGIGVSALAKYYLVKGYQVSGCDLVASEITQQLSEQGVIIRIGTPEQTRCFSNVKKTHDRENFTHWVIYSPAVSKDHPERIAARKEKIPEFSYPQALGELTKTHFTIAVSGTHGKSTTTAMIGLLLTRAGIDPTVIVGTKLKEFGPSTNSGSNCRVGKGKYLVIEADEHFASFLNYWPKIIVLTTIEADHLDYWKTLKNLLKGFQKYISHIPQDGTLVANKDDKNIRKIISSKHNNISAAAKKVLWYSLKQKEASTLRRILKVPGQHNVSNALAALAVARILGIKDVTSFKALGEFQGTWRRFEIFKLSTPKPYTLVSDYGHHPTEVKVTVQAAREKWPKKKIWLVFQPHQYQRTYYLWKNFVQVLSRLPVDKLVLTDIYDVAGREETSIKKKVSSEKLAEETKNYKLKTKNFDILYIPTLSKTESYLKQNLQGGEIVMVMGAGDIYNLTLALTRKHPKGRIKT